MNSEEEKKELTGGLTSTEIENLKRKWGPLTLVSVDGLHFWFRKPDMKTLAAAAAIAERDPMGSTQVYFENCLVHGDASLAQDVDIWLAIAPHLSGLIEEKRAEVKKF